MVQQGRLQLFGRRIVLLSGAMRCVDSYNVRGANPENPSVSNVGLTIGRWSAPYRYHFARSAGSIGALLDGHSP
jgi:hypothetical protein